MAGGPQIVLQKPLFALSRPIRGRPGSVCQRILTAVSHCQIRLQNLRLGARQNPPRDGPAPLKNRGAGPIKTLNVVTGPPEVGEVNTIGPKRGRWFNFQESSMSLILNTNIASLNAQRNLTSSQSQLSQSLQRLSSGLRINSAADDAAGLAISNNSPRRSTAPIRPCEMPTMPSRRPRPRRAL